MARKCSLVAACRRLSLPLGLGLTSSALLLVLLALLTSSPVSAGDNVWTWDGAFGNVETILSNPIAPGIAYAVLDTGHLFRTTSAGTAWSALPDPPHAGAALSVRLAPNDANVLFLWGYDAGLFAYRSVDGGATWQPLSMAGELAVSPADWREVYLSAGGSLFKSIDGGDTWAAIGQFPTACPAPLRLSIAPSAPQVMVSVMNPPGSMDFSLCRSIDGGRTWSPLPITSPMIHAVVFDPKNSNTVYVAGLGGGMKSTDGGSTWAPLSGALNNPAQFVIDPDNTQVIHVADLNQPGGVFESKDGGASWNIVNLGIQALSVRTIAIASRQPLKIYAGVMTSGVWEITRTAVQDYSITVNDGALFTNQTAVTLTLTAPPGTTQMMIANDGGFGGAAWEPFATSKPWTITAYGYAVIPRTVYAKFTTNGQTSAQYQDDIVLDLTSPTGSIAVGGTAPAAPAREQAAAGSWCCYVYLPIVVRDARPGMRPVGLILSASDDVSGLGGMLVSNDAAFAGAQWQIYANSRNWWVADHGTTTVYVKYRDRAGNESPIYSATTVTP